jgi:hypothetical protein
MIKAKIEGGTWYTVSVSRNIHFNSPSKIAKTQIYNYGQKRRERSEIVENLKHHM